MADRVPPGWGQPPNQHNEYNTYPYVDDEQDQEYQAYSPQMVNSVPPRWQVPYDFNNLPYMDESAAAYPSASGYSSQSGEPPMQQAQAWTYWQGPYHYQYPAQPADPSLDQAVEHEQAEYHVEHASQPSDPQSDEAVGEDETQDDYRLPRPWDGERVEMDRASVSPDAGSFGQNGPSDEGEQGDEQLNIPKHERPRASKSRDKKKPRTHKKEHDKEASKKFEHLHRKHDRGDRRDKGSSSSSSAHHSKRK